MVKNNHSPKKSQLCIAISGSSGLLAGALIPKLQAKGHQVIRLVRRETKASDEKKWDPQTGEVESAGEFDALVHLAGENIGGGRWTRARKEALRASRVDATRKLVEHFLTKTGNLKTLVTASAIGFYGDSGDSLVNEDATRGEGFLAELVEDWENAASAASEAGVRTVLLRFGILLSPKGGALGRLLPPFKAGLGGRMGRGDQWMSWAALDDAARAIVFALENDSLFGPMNVASPNPVRNQDFAKTLGSVLKRPVVLPTPKAGLDLLLGRQMAKEMLFFSTRVDSQKLIKSGFDFRHPDLKEALIHELSS
jgi:uncharacterized protein (TIGR01777 family)